MHKIEFVIGDWSHDGHSQSESFMVLSSVPVEELREINFLDEEVLGFKIGDICREYNEYDVRSDIAKRLRDIGILSQGAEVSTRNLLPDDVMEIWVRSLRYIAEKKNIQLTLDRIAPGDVEYLPLDVLKYLIRDVKKKNPGFEVIVDGEPSQNPANFLFTELVRAAKKRRMALTVGVSGGKPQRSRASTFAVLITSNAIWTPQATVCSTFKTMLVLNANKKGGENRRL